MAPASAPAAVDLGELELTPTRSSVTIAPGRRSTACIESNVKFRVRNKSAGDIKLILFRNNLSASDGNGNPLLQPRYVTSGGVAMSEMPANQMRLAFSRESAKLVSVAPKQTIEVQLNMPGNRLCRPDPTGDLLRTYRPKTLTLSGALGVVDVANAVDVRSFSLIDAPVHAAAR